MFSEGGGVGGKGPVLVGNCVYIGKKALNQVTVSSRLKKKIVGCYMVN